MLAKPPDSSVKGSGVRIIDLEAHMLTPELAREKWSGADGGTLQDILCDVGQGRLKAMDTDGIAMQALSVVAPVQMLEPAEGTAWARHINDTLGAAVKAHPDRFIGLAAVAPQDPDAATVEIKRAVKDLGLQGVSVLSHARNEYLDNRKYWPVFRQAEELGVPVYLQPATPSTAILKGYIDYGFPFAGPALGFAADVSLHVMRLIYSGLFDAYPRLKIILGHMGEGLPFFLFRIDEFYTALAGKLKKKPSQYIKDNFFITTSGMFFQPARICSYLSLGPERIAFAIDYPPENSQLAVKFIKEAPICDSDKEKICHGNVEALLKL